MPFLATRPILLRCIVVMEHVLHKQELSCVYHIVSY